MDDQHDGELIGDLKAIEAVAGREAALAIGRSLAGRVLQVPSTTARPVRFSGVLATIEGLIGHELTLRFVEAYGGQKVTVPSGRTRAPSRLAGVIGRAAATKLGEEFGAEMIDVPRAFTSVQASRGHSIDQLILDGFSLNAVAQRCGVTARAVSFRKRRMVEQGLLISRREPAPSPDKIVSVQMRRMLVAGYAADAIAAELGTDVGRVKRERRDAARAGLALPREASSIGA